PPLIPLMPPCVTLDLLSDHFSSHSLYLPNPLPITLEMWGYLNNADCEWQVAIIKE
ncbi:hypothetical protein KUCAC02_019801, partial [Chaenocephalus aceratus]